MGLHASVAGFTGESFQALHQGRHKTKLLVVLSVLTVVCHGYLTLPQAQRSEQGQLPRSSAASAVC